MQTARDHLDRDTVRDRLRIIALGRIPRCRDCPRYRALEGRGRARTYRLPDVPAGCRHPACLALRDRTVPAGRARPDVSRETRPRTPPRPAR